MKKSINKNDVFIDNSSNYDINFPIFYNKKTPIKDREIVNIRKGTKLKTNYTNSNSNFENSKANSSKSRHKEEN